jgi:hypothetical protein
MGEITKRSYRLSDGREIIYFDDADTALSPERSPDLREPAARPPTAAMRKDVPTGEWISVASARQNRVVLPPSHLDPLAPATADNPSEVPSHYDVAVFENKSPSFGPGLGEPWRSRAGGAGRVVLEGEHWTAFVPFITAPATPAPARRPGPAAPRSAAALRCRCSGAQRSVRRRRRGL